MTNGGVGGRLLPFLPELCPVLYEHEPLIDVVEEHVCPAQQTCVCTFE